MNDNIKNIFRGFSYISILLLFTLLGAFLLTGVVSAQENSSTEVAFSELSMNSDVTLEDAYAINCSVVGEYFVYGKEYGVPALFDNNTSTKWFSEASSTVSSTYPISLIMKYSDSFTISGYRMTTADDNVRTGRSPMEWKLYGSNTGNDGSWTEIHYVENGGFTDNYQQKSFNLDSDVSYQYYKFEFLSINGNGVDPRGVQISELNFIVAERGLTEYKWSWGGVDRPDSVNAVIGKNTLTKTEKNYYTTTNPIILSKDRDWVIEWKGFNTENAIMFSGTSGGYSSPYFYPLAKDDDTTGYFVALRNSGTVTNFVIFTNLDEALVKDNNVVWSFEHRAGGTYILTATKDGVEAYSETKSGSEIDLSFSCVLGYFKTNAELPYSTYIDYLHVYEKEAQDDLISDEDLALEYGDYVAVSKQGTETSVISGDDVIEIIQMNGMNYIHAIAVGDATIIAGDVERKITVGKAKVNLVLVAGQSNANGIHGGKGSVISPEYGNGFWWDGTALQDLKLHIQTITATSVGWYPALAAEWHSLTGEKTVIIHKCIPGAPISSWADYITGSVTSYTQSISTSVTNCIEALQNNENIELVRTGYYWLQGETDAFLTNSEGVKDYTTAKKYKTAYMSMHDAYIEALNVANLPAPYGAIISVRTRNEIGSYNAIEYCGVRAAQQYIANEYDDIYMASVIADSWTSKEIKFTSKVGVTVTTTGSAAGANNIHYNQVGYNILGMDAADNMYDALFIEDKPVVTDFELIGHDGRTKYSDESVINIEENLRYIGTNNVEEDANKAQIAVRVLPISASAAQVQMTVTDKNGIAVNGVIDEYGHIDITKVTEKLTLTVKVGDVKKTFTLTNEAMQNKVVSFDDEKIKYVGRWLMENDHAEGYWSGTYFETKFTGSVFKISLGEAATIYVAADGKDAVQIKDACGTIDLSEYLDQTFDEHTVRIGVANDQGTYLMVQRLIIGKEQQLLDTDEKPLIEFIGDSITAGAYLGPESANTYAFITSQILGVDYAPISIGGIALVDGNNGNRGNGICTSTTAAMNQRYFLQKPLDKDAPNGEWDFATYTPNLIIINLGTNDGIQGEEANTFASVYVDFVKSIREKHGSEVPIVLLIPLQGYMKDGVITAYETLNDMNTYLIDASDWITKSDCLDGVHPTKAGHTVVAEQLAASIRKVLLNAEIAAAKATANDVETIDGKDSSDVIKGKKFVTSSEMEALTTAINIAERAKENVVTLEDVFLAKKALNSAVEIFRSEIKTGAYVAISGITLDNNDLTLGISSAITLTVTFSPEDASNKTVVWMSSNERVATVENGVVTAVDAGEALITANVTTDDGEFCATCTVIVDPCLNGHTEVVDAAVSATCTEHGLTVGKHCSDCGKILIKQISIPAKGHKWVDADCDDPKTCSSCGETEGEPIGHDYVDGECKVCGEVDPAVAPEIPDKSDHSECESGWLANIWNAIINFFRRLIGLPEKCVCGEIK